MTAPDLDALERAAQAATPGPWTAHEAGIPASSGRHFVARTGGEWVGATGYGPQSYRDAAYIAAANPAAIRSLIARLREAERQRDEARAALETISESHIPSMPMTAADDELAWAQKHVAHLRRIALKAISGEPT